MTKIDIPQYYMQSTQDLKLFSKAWSKWDSLPAYVHTGEQRELFQTLFQNLSNITFQVFAQSGSDYVI